MEAGVWTGKTELIELKPCEGHVLKKELTLAKLMLCGPVNREIHLEETCTRL